MATLGLVLRLGKDIEGWLDKILIVVINLFMLVANSLVGEDSSEWLACANIGVTYVGKVVGGINGFEVVLCWERSVGGIGKKYLENNFLVLTGFGLLVILFNVLCSSPVDGDCQRQTDASRVLPPIIFVRDASFWCPSLGFLQLLLVWLSVIWQPCVWQ